MSLGCGNRIKWAISPTIMVSSMHAARVGAHGETGECFQGDWRRERERGEGRVRVRDRMIYNMLGNVCPERFRKGEKERERRLK